MCLQRININKNEYYDKNEIKEDSYGKYIIRYKVVYRNPKISKKVKYVSLNMHTPCYLKKFTISNRKNKKITKIELRHDSINFGIHVYKYLRSWHFNKTVLPVKCYLKDFVAYGRYGEAVFIKVWFIDEPIKFGVAYDKGILH